MQIGMVPSERPKEIGESASKQNITMVHEGTEVSMRHRTKMGTIAPTGMIGRKVPSQEGDFEH
jgi:hypothetical protein